MPQHLYDKIYIAVLTTTVNLVTEAGINNLGYEFAPKKTIEYRVALQLTEMAVGAHLKAIKFDDWPYIVQVVLYNKLYDMVGLEILDLGRGLTNLKTLDKEKMITSGVSAMPNLVCFILHDTCTDNIILALAKNCEKLQKLDVTNSKSVTEYSVTPLLSCEHLRYINLHRTTMNIRGYANLFLDHLKIEDIGTCNRFGGVLEYIHSTAISDKRFFHIRTLGTRNISSKCLHYLIDICPYITSLSLEYNYGTVDLAILATLKYLTKLELRNYDFYAHGIKTLLKIKGCAIISLHLYRLRGIDLNALILISQYCPDIRNLVLCGYKFLEHATIDPQQLAVRPFQFLERIEFIGECTNMDVELLLSHCINIKFIHIIPSNKVGDDTMRRILLQNPMSKLEELRMWYCPHLSIKTVQLLMQKCDNLRRLSKLECWGISSEELNIFREDLKTTNINLDTSI